MAKKDIIDRLFTTRGNSQTIIEIATGGTLALRQEALQIYANGDTSKTPMVVPATQFARVRAAVVSLADSASAQACFAAANDTLTVLGGTLYRVEFNIFLTTGASSHATSFGFAGTATATSVQITLLGRSAADNTLAAPQWKEMEALAATAATAASTAVQTHITGFGLIETNGAGTLIPQITFGAQPGSTNQVEIGSYILLQQLGTTEAAVGAWA